MFKTYSGAGEIAESVKCLPCNHTDPDFDRHGATFKLRAEEAETDSLRLAGSQ